MKSIFIDTGAFIALRVQDDINHNSSKKYLDKIKKEKLVLHTSNFILDEVYTYFCKYHNIAIGMGEMIKDNPIISLHRITFEDEENSWQILNKYNDKTFSYTDATSFSLMERLKINTAFTYDLHFKQYGNFITVPK